MDICAIVMQTKFGKRGWSQRSCEGVIAEIYDKLAAKAGHKINDSYYDSEVNTTAGLFQHFGGEAEVCAVGDTVPLEIDAVKKGKKTRRRPLEIWLWFF